MSKIGKINISIPEKVKVVLNGNILNIEGPLGKKSLNFDLNMFDLNIKDGKEVSIKPKKIDDDSKRLWGMNRSLLNNAIIGTSTGYSKTLADNVTNGNALLRHIDEKGNKQIATGRTIVQELEYATNSTAKWYSGYEVLDTSPSTKLPVVTLSRPNM